MSRVNKKAFGDFIKSKRIEKGITQEELAGLLNVSSMTVSKWETGRRYPDFEMVDDIAGVFGISVEEIYENSKGEEGKGYSFNISIGIVVVALAVIGVLMGGVLNKPEKVALNNDSEETDVSMWDYKDYLKHLLKRGGLESIYYFCETNKEHPFIYVLYPEIIIFDGKDLQDRRNQYVCFKINDGLLLDHYNGAPSVFLSSLEEVDGVLYTPNAVKSARLLADGISKAKYMSVGDGYLEFEGERYYAISGEEYAEMTKQAD